VKSISEEPSAGLIREGVALVVGGSSGIGASISSILASSGVRVVLVGRDGARLDALTRSLPHASALSRDMTSHEDCLALRSELEALVEHLDYFVYSAGVFAPSPIQQVTREDWNLMLDTNLTGAFFAFQSALPLLGKGTGKSAVFISSILAHRGAPETAVYSAAKGGVSALTRALAVELAPQGIRVNSVSPGHVRSPMTRDMLSEADGLDSDCALYPLGRLGCPEDVAELVLFLLGGRSSWITGADYLVDGGRMAAD
jgi:NAD(P)-dependent dehydrogenase (short-subunit alcohol dehydrogenase family)